MCDFNARLFYRFSAASYLFNCYPLNLLTMGYTYTSILRVLCTLLCIEKKNCTVFCRLDKCFTSTLRWFSARARLGFG